MTAHERKVLAHVVSGKLNKQVAFDLATTRAHPDRFMEKLGIRTVRRTRAYAQDVGSQKFIGRRPIAAFGNSDGDLPMLQWISSGAGLRFGLIVQHTDDKREWAYDRKSPIGTLDKALDEGRKRGWTVVSMRDDWKRIFTFEK